MGSKNNMTSNLTGEDLKRLPEKNVQEARRLVQNLERFLGEIRQAVGKIKISDLRSKIQNAPADPK